MKNFKQEMKWKVQRIKNIYHWLAAMYAVIRWGYPAGKMTVIGVTGTDGKTTTSTLIYEMLMAAGIKAGLISTVEAKIGNETADTGLHTTNPDPRQLQPLIKRMAGKGITHLVLEVTAHGLDQSRVLGCNFKIGVLTNITHEHLDDFVDMKRYREAKLKLFGGVEDVVLNGDDPGFEYIKSQITNHKSQTNSNTRIFKYKKTTLKSISPALDGDYNKYNIGAAEIVGKILKIDPRIVAGVVKNFTGVPGRREEVKAGQDFRVIVDFAHTPNALEQVLKQLRTELRNRSRLILVFGCTGERDKTKRPMMGEIAERLADVAIITSDDTRGESQDEIAAQIISGMKNTPLKSPSLIKEGVGGVLIENDRKKAIEMAIGMAKSGDVVLLAGKGHEKSILLGKTEYPWSDEKVAKEIIAKAKRP